MDILKDDLFHLGKSFQQAPRLHITKVDGDHIEYNELVIIRKTGTRQELLDRITSIDGILYRGLGIHEIRAETPDPQ